MTIQIPTRDETTTSVNPPRFRLSKRQFDDNNRRYVGDSRAAIERLGLRIESQEGDFYWATPPSRHWQLTRLHKGVSYLLDGKSPKPVATQYVKIEPKLEHHIVIHKT